MGSALPSHRGHRYPVAVISPLAAPPPKWHLDEVFIKIDGERKSLGQAVDQDGMVLDILVQNRRDKAAARRFFHAAAQDGGRGAAGSRHGQAPLLRRRPP